MPHFVEELQQEAAEAIEVMQKAALAARHIHARAELMRHMRTTAAKSKDKPKNESVEAVLAEWLEAWYVPRNDWPHIAEEMEKFTATFYDYVNDPSNANDQRMRDATDALDKALAAEGTTISDQMAFRSMCAHGWWEAVLPTPQDLPGRVVRPTVPALQAGHPFWDAACADQCR
ncbi:hypothetical protein JF546_22135 [Nitratireductor aquimarinus]|uniref:hypothetical protein n=1 Tax=Nitratireductor aquimarinus TaxID=889300 RepID=UPI001A8D2FB9|nr:hypothetical protein [Nitratireductor aquimarinus]MBN8245719.1 hypothetical protein [Nitratireductor aquimarinus]MBY6134100.1 hypothetical protein [Nitratireductor aquimarinus]MCA1305209.1 hypothetical protein [Nitratireductor aquimarinus]